VPASPDISVVVCTYQRPYHLRRCLLSLAAQQGVAGRFEVLVVDDGSADETPDVVARFAHEVTFRVEFITHPHDGFQQARCRNEGILASRAPYILFTDADCIFPVDHLAQHLAARRPGVARAGDCFRIDQPTSERIDELAVQSGLFHHELAPVVRRWRGPLYLKQRFYQITHNPLRPKLIGWNMGISRDDIDRANGFDQKFRAWSCEDDDLAARLRAAGVKIRTALGYTYGYHLWHAPHSTTPTLWRDGPNVPYLRRPVRLISCLDGLAPRSFENLSLRTIAGPTHARLAREVAARFTSDPGPLELELLFWPGNSSFSKVAHHRILLTRDENEVPARIRRQAHAVISLGMTPTAESVTRDLRQLLVGAAMDPAVGGARRAA
jgi:glycosyltransferase involved in cell wall biosynthesis